MENNKILYKRICPHCGRIIYHKNIVSYKKALNENVKCRKCSYSEYHNSIRNDDIERLLSEELETYYWIGFILSDGTISENYRLKICLSIKDYNHLYNFAKYIGVDKIKTYNRSCEISLMSKTYIGQLSLKFNIKHNKTYNPPLIDIYTQIDIDKFKALVIGFIDGDGCIRKQYKRNDCLLKIKLHSSWINFLNLISERLQGKEIAKIQNNGYANLNISNNSIIKELKEFAISNKLPIMHRKWDIVDTEYITFYEKADEKVNKIKKLIDENQSITIKEICKKLNYKYGCVYRIIRVNNFNIRKEKIYKNE